MERLSDFHFSFTDLLAYIVPGIAAVVAIALLFSLSPVGPLLDAVQWNVVTALLALALSYLAGVTFSSLDYFYCDALYRLFGLKKPWDTIPLEEFTSEVQQAFSSIVPNRKWSRGAFFIARTYVRERSPSLAAVVDRQNALAQLRRNSVAPLFLWGTLGCAWGAKVAFNGQWWVGAVAVLASAIATCLCIWRLYIAMNQNATREVREVCTSLLVLIPGKVDQIPIHTDTQHQRSNDLAASSEGPSE